MKPSNNLQIIILSILISTSVINCSSDKGSDNSAIVALLAANQISNLPQPNTDTVSMIIGTDYFTLTDKLDCKEGVGGIGFLTADADQMPTLFIHNVDFSLNSGVSVTGGAGPFHVDIDTDPTTYAPTNTCPASILENTVTIYDLQVVNCGVSPFGGGATNTVSFRVRCVKD
ncbi:hypothetical protein [Leptospira sarikeiensis]|uniref:Uncharacterized protein n=1 Tax=Leptospira sarikeiensis TaxID=2484943 RepID=A0A4R9K963_9LEPT|nr:hypothetical protein [Leptospira sarikeiensis]TGL62046.1 hypothetical protein EHQ64_08885 [Leptospira sarikeiensis]